MSIIKLMRDKHLVLSMYPAYRKNTHLSTQEIFTKIDHALHQ